MKTEDYKIIEVDETRLVSFMQVVRNYYKKGKWTTSRMSPAILNRVLRTEAEHRRMHKIRSLINSHLMTYEDFKLWVIVKAASNSLPHYSQMPFYPEEYTEVAREFSMSALQKDNHAFSAWREKLMRSPNQPSVLHKHPAPYGFYAEHVTGYSLMWSITRGVPRGNGYPEGENEGVIGLGFYLRGLLDCGQSKVIQEVSANELQFRMMLMAAVKDRIFMAGTTARGEVSGLKSNSNNSNNSNQNN